MALVRVYCGLASVDAVGRTSAAGALLTAAVVDDTGRLLDLCEFADDPAGYSQLSNLLAERTTGPYSVAIAADRDDRLVTMLLTTAGWAIALAGDGAVDEFTERYAGDLTGEIASQATQRRAIGLARALHAGALSVALLSTPAAFVAFKPLLAAHGALVTGRHAAATALREVLRELYPAALRAYPDPSDPVALAVIDALPEPGNLSSSASGQGLDAATAVDAVTVRLTESGVADQSTIAEAVTALQVAIAETPRRSGLSRTLTTTVAEAIRQSAAAVRACDAAGAVLVAMLADQVTSTVPAHRVRETAQISPAPAYAQISPAPTLAQAPVAAGRMEEDTLPTGQSRRSRSRAAPEQATPVNGASTQTRPARRANPRPPVPEPMAPPPVAPRPVAPPPRAPAAPAPLPAAPESVSFPTVQVSPPAGSMSSAPPARTRPISAPPPPPPGIAPIAKPRQPRKVLQPQEPATPAAHTGNGADHLSHVPTPRRPVPDGPPPGSRSEWPTSPPPDEWTTTPDEWATTPDEWATVPDDPPGGPARERVTPPWRSDDLRLPEPSGLRLAESALPTELKDDLGYSGSWQEPAPLRLVEPPGTSAPQSVPPVAASASDDDLLIFAQTRSAWFTGHDEETSWSSSMDAGWQMAEHAAQPAVGERTEMGLPRRVPHANLVPGSPPRSAERPLQIIRDPASIAAHTSGYFSGWRRGQQVGGFPLGGRPGRQAAGAWDFNRDDDREYGT